MQLFIFVLIGIFCVAPCCLAGQDEGHADAPRIWSLPLGRDAELSFIWNHLARVWACRYEITNEQYRRFDASHIGTNYHYYGRVTDEDRQPAVFVSWEDAHNFCEWVTRRFGAHLPDGFVCRLPTELEWVALAGCGTPRAYPWGNRWPPPNDWNYRGEEGAGVIFQLFQKDPFLVGHDDAYVVAGPVERSGINEGALYGMGGNVWEWCQDWYDTNRWTRVVRGGSWYNYEKRHLALSHRAEVNPEWKNAMIGFRVVVAPRGDPAP